MQNTSKIKHLRKIVKREKCVMKKYGDVYDDFKLKYVKQNKIKENINFVFMFFKRNFQDFSKYFHPKSM